MAQTITIHRVTIDTSNFHGLAPDMPTAERYALAWSKWEPGVEFVLCDTDTGEWLDSFIVTLAEVD